MQRYKCISGHIYVPKYVMDSVCRATNIPGMLRLCRILYALTLSTVLTWFGGIVTACNQSVELDERVCFSFSLCMFKKSQVIRHC